MRTALLAILIAIPCFAGKRIVMSLTQYGSTLRVETLLEAQRVRVNFGMKESIVFLNDGNNPRLLHVVPQANEYSELSPDLARQLAARLNHIAANRPPETQNPANVPVAAGETVPQSDRRVKGILCTVHVYPGAEICIARPEDLKLTEAEVRSWATMRTFTAIVAHNLINTPRFMVANSINGYFRLGPESIEDQAIQILHPSIGLLQRPYVDEVIESVEEVDFTDADFLTKP